MLERNRCHTPYCPGTCAAAATDFTDHYADQVIGGYKVMIWQYYNNDCGGSQDLDISPYAGYQNSQWNPVSG